MQLVNKRFYRLLPNIAVLVPLIFLLFFWSSGYAVSENRLINGTFTPDGGGWLGDTGGNSCWGGRPSIGQWEPDAIAFSYVTNTITQQVTVNEPTELLLTFDARNRPEEYINGQFEVSISGPDGVVSTGPTVPQRVYSQFSLNYTTTEPNAVLTVSISGSDNGLFWAGCYGPMIRDIRLVDVAEPWPPYLTGEAWENGTITLTAPEGTQFSEVLFASYGTPNGFEIGWCHAVNSEEIVSDIFIGQTTASIAASNAVFGDPCGGTVKKLIIAVAYEEIAPESTTTTTVPETTTTTTVLETTTTTTVPESTTTTTVLETTTTTTVPETTTTTTVPETTTTTAVPGTTTVPESTSTTIPEITTTTTEPPTTTVPEEPVVEPPVDIDEIIGDGITPDEAVAAASSPELLEELDASEAKEVFSAIDTSEISDEEAAAIVAAVQDAPKTVRKAFENTVDVFSGKFDEYVMVNSKINVGDRRTIVAVTVVASITAIATVNTQPPTGGGSTGGPSGGSNNSGSGTSGKSEDEEEEGPAGEIAGDGVNWVSEISIYKEINGEKIMNWKAFIKKFLFGIMNLGFTISGSIVVYFTLSGTIQRIALVSTLIALAAAMYLHMYEPKNDE